MTTIFRPAASNSHSQLSPVKLRPVSTAGIVFIPNSVPMRMRSGRIIAQRFPAGFPAVPSQARTPKGVFHLPAHVVARQAGGVGQFLDVHRWRRQPQGLRAFAQGRGGVVEGLAQRLAALVRRAVAGGQLQVGRRGHRPQAVQPRVVALDVSRPLVPAHVGHEVAGSVVFLARGAAAVVLQHRSSEARLAPAA